MGPKVFGRDDLSINLLELLVMTVTAWAFTVQAATPPNYPGASILMRGDNSSGVHRVKSIPGGSGAAVGYGDANDGLSRNAQWVVFSGKTRQRGR